MQYYKYNDLVGAQGNFNLYSINNADIHLNSNVIQYSFFPCQIKLIYKYVTHCLLGSTIHI